MEADKLLEIVIKAADSKKAQDIVALNVAQVSGLADYFVIMEAMNARQIAAVIEAIDEEVSKVGVEIGAKTEGQPDSGWVLLDLGDIIVSVFNHDTRLRFNLEKLWSDAPLADIQSWISE